MGIPVHAYGDKPLSGPTQQCTIPTQPQDLRAFRLSIILYHRKALPWPTYGWLSWVGRYLEVHLWAVPPIPMA